MNRAAAKIHSMQQYFQDAEDKEGRGHQEGMVDGKSKPIQARSDNINE